MEKMCPFLKKMCVKEKCMFWDEDEGCLLVEGIRVFKRVNAQKKEY